MFWGLVLIGSGLVFLALTTGLVPGPGTAVIGAAFAIAGLAFVAAYLTLHLHWWTLIVGPALLALGGVILLPGGGGGALFLGGIGVGFALVALGSSERWWAIIPAGSLLTLALVSVLSSWIGGLLSGAVLFAGLAVTFGVVALVRVHGNAMRWALYPAMGCLLMALLIAGGEPGSRFIWPVLIVALGVFLLIRAATRRA